MIDFVTDWTFSMDDPYVMASKIKPYNFEIDIKLDFFGMVTLHTKKDLTNRIIMFGIEYDYAGRKYVSGDYLKQFYLRQMNVHLLRLNNRMNLEQEIKKFILSIINNQKYVIRNGLKMPNYDAAERLTSFYTS